MSILKIPLRFEGSKSEKVINALFDSGANLSCIHPDLAAQIANLEPLLHPKKLATASENMFVEINSAIRTDFYIDDVQLSDEFLVVPGLSEEAIIGAATLQKWRIKLDIENDVVIVDPKVSKLQLI